MAYAALGEARGNRVEHHDDLGLMLADGESPGLFANVAVASGRSTAAGG